MNISQLLSLPDGIIYDSRSAIHRILIRKEDSVLRMVFVDPNSDDKEPFLSSGTMSAIDLEDPMDLSITPYTQSLMLPLLWNDSPELIYVVGFAGGHIPFVYHQMFKNIYVESTDIDFEMKVLSKKYFGVKFDVRQKLFIQDGREYLENQPPDKEYDFILIDAFRSISYAPLHMGTIEFFDICTSHLSQKGVLAVNLHENDPLYIEKLRTLKKSFQYIYLEINPQTVVVFATNGPHIKKDTLNKHARKLQTQYKFAFPFLERAKNIIDPSEAEKYIELFGSDNSHLTDKDLRHICLEKIDRNNPMFYGAKLDESCPCGSQRLFRNCHGSIG